MITSGTSMDPEAIVAKLDSDGVVKLDAFLSPDTVRAVRLELDAARAAMNDAGDPPSQRGPSMYPTSLLRHGRLREISEISRIMTSPVLDEVRAKKIGRSAYVTDIVGIESLPAHAMITPWHVDGTLSCIEKPGNARIKLFFYLNDVTHKNGAFSYIPRTQLVLDTIHRAMNRGEIEPVNIRDLSSLRELFERQPPMLPGDLQTLVEEMFRLIESDTAPCGPYSLQGPTGTLIIFDERGVHRGGDISEGHRSILRISLKQEALNSATAVSRAVARKLARVVLPPRYARLM